MKKTSNVRLNLILLYLHYSLIIVWIALMVLIVWFSDQPDTVSTEQSLTVGKWLCGIFVNGYESLNSTTQIEYAKMIDHLVRKSAHFCEYAVLGALTYNAAYIFFNLLKNRFKVDLKSTYLVISSILWCLLFATTDEIHQRFVPGRYGSPLDVLLDAAGATVGIAIILIIRKAVDRSRSKQLSRQKDI